MNKLKDFFYNKNDIIIVLIIVLVAGFIIYSRIDAIMAYPEEMAAKTAQEQKQAEAESAAKDTSATSVSDTVSITITDEDTQDTVATKLYKAGLVPSDTEFSAYIASAGKTDALKTGTFQIKKGALKEDILKIIAN